MSISKKCGYGALTQPEIDADRESCWKCQGNRRKLACEVCGRSEPITCPFCGAKDFDAVGLKSHIEHGDCERFNVLERVARI